MTQLRGIRWLQSALLLVLSAAALPVMAGIIYVWKDSSETGGTGFIEFADIIELGDTVDPTAAGSIKDFEFFVLGGDLTSSDLTFSLDDLVLDNLGLCSPNCDQHGQPKTKATAKKVAERILFRLPTVAKKKASQGGTTTTSPPYNWFYSGQVLTTTKTKTGTIEQFVGFSGSGVWVLDNAVPVPEPGTLFLFLTGLGGLSIARRKFRK